MPGVHMVAPKSLSMQELARTIEAGYWAKQEVETCRQTHAPEANSSDPIPAWAPVQTADASPAEDMLNEQTLVDAM